MGEVSNWIPSSFSKPPEIQENESNPEPALPPAAPPESAPVPITDQASDDLSFDLISRQKLSLTPQSSGVGNQDRLSPKGAPGVPVFEEDTRSSWSVESTKTTPIKEMTVDETSQNSSGSQKSTVKRKFCEDESSPSIIFPPENVFEYMWPMEKGEFYFLQEQISDYLSVKSFKRKYPDLQRRSVDIDEKQFLRERGVVTETQCDLGLTALRSEDVMELMSKDYPQKYKDYIRVLREKEKRNLSEKQKEHTSANADKNKMADCLRKAIKSASEYNAHLNQERKEERRSCFDLQTYTIHYPTGLNRTKPPSPKMGKFPVALLPGQFQDSYKVYTPEELKYLPLNTVLYGPLQELKSLQALSDASHSDSEDSTASDGSCSSSQGTHDDGSGESTSGSEKNAKPQNASNTETPTTPGKGTLATPGKGTLATPGKGTPATLGKGTPATLGKGTLATLGKGTPATLGKGTPATPGKGTPATPGKGTPATPGKGTPATPGKGTLATPGKGTLATLGKGTPATPGKGTPKPQTPYKPKDKPNALCKVCKFGSGTEKDEKNEPLLHCSQCESSGHPTCLQLTLGMVDVLKTYPWQCIDCKNCSHCRDPYDEDKMLFCDNCDRGYHTFCVGLKALPQGKWICQLCGHCAVCGASKPGPESSKAQWQYDAVATENIQATQRPQIVCQTCFKRKR